jgi:hypothetical protein
MRTGRPAFRKNDGVLSLALYDPRNPSDWGLDNPLAAAGLPNAGTTGTPALLEHNGKLFVVHEGKGQDGHLYWLSFDGAAWSGDTQLANVGTTRAPALASHDGALYALHEGLNHDGQLWSSKYTEAQGWLGDQQVFNVGIGGVPAAAAWDRLYCVHQGLGNNHQLWSTSYPVAQILNPWTPDQQITANSAGTMDTPSLAVYHNQLIAVYEADDGSGKLSWSVLPVTDAVPPHAGEHWTEASGPNQFNYLAIDTSATQGQYLAATRMFIMPIGVGFAHAVLTAGADVPDDAANFPTAPC